MSFVLKLIIYPILLIIFLVAFFPTKYAYYSLQHILYKKFTITLKSKHISSIPFKFDINNLEIGLGQERVASLGLLSLHTYLVTNSFKVTKIYIDDSLAPEYLKNLQEINVVYNLYKPLDVYIKIKSPIFVRGHIYFDINKRSIIFTMYVKPSQVNKVRDIDKFFKIQKRGVYVYEYQL